MRLQGEIFAYLSAWKKEIPCGEFALRQQAASSAIPHRVKSNNMRLLFFIIELEAAPHGFNYKDNIFHEVEESRTIPIKCGPIFTYGAFSHGMKI